MKCEICGEDPLTLVFCQHPKNGYCGLFLLQAEKDAKTFAGKTTLVDLAVGDTFRYKNSDENDWHTVIKVDEEKIYYPGYLSDYPNSNYRVNNIEVILK